MENVKTVQELIDVLKKLPKDAKLIKQTSNSMEMGGSLVLGTAVEVGKYSAKKESFRDAFDGGSYSSTVYVSDDKGDKCVRFF
jgi:hypothetical protein